MEKFDEVVDKIAERLGMAVQEIQPLAEEVVRQYQVRALVFSVGAGIATLFFLWVHLHADKRLKEDIKLQGGTSDSPWGVVSIMAMIPICLFFYAAVIHLGKYLAPLPSLLGL